MRERGRELPQACRLRPPPPCGSNRRWRRGRAAPPRRDRRPATGRHRRRAAAPGRSAGDSRQRSSRSNGAVDRRDNRVEIGERCAPNTCRGRAPRIAAGVGIVTGAGEGDEVEPWPLLACTRVAPLERVESRAIALLLGGDELGEVAAAGNDVGQREIAQRRDLGPFLSEPSMAHGMIELVVRYPFSVRTPRTRIAAAGPFLHGIPTENGQRAKPSA